MVDHSGINIEIIGKVAEALEEINTEVIYVGGAVISLYATEKGSDIPRVTKDIDISVRVSTYSQMEELRLRLARKKIFPTSSGNIMYRYAYQDILIDFIPFEETPLGPTNSWLKPGFKHSREIKVFNTTIRILPASYFLATKWEAYRNRGSDPRASHDFEDIIFVLNNHADLVDDVAKSEIKVIEFLKEMCHEIQSHASRDEIIECHLHPGSVVERRNLVLNKLQQISDV